MALKQSLIQQAVSKVQQFASNIGKSVSDNQGWFQQGQFTPIKAITNNWSSYNPITQGLVKAQTIGENFVKNPIPQFNIQPQNNLLSKVGKTVANIPIGMANSVVGGGILSPLTDVAQMGLSKLGGTSPTYDTMRSGAGRLGLQVAGKINPDTISQYGTKYSGKQIVGNLANTSLPILNAWTPTGGKALVEQGLKGGSTILNSIKTGAMEGGKLGAGFGLIQGLSDNREVQKNIDYIKNVGLSSVSGAVFGAVLGGALKGIPEAYSQVKNILTNKVQQIKPNLTPQQAEQEAVRYIKLESGRLAGSKPKFKDINDVKFIGDLRESIGLSRNGDEIPQMGLSIRSKTKEEHIAGLSKISTPEVGGIAKLIEDTKVKRLQVLKDIESLKSKSPMSQSVELPKLQKKLDMYESVLTNHTGNPEGWRGGAQLNEMESPLSPIKTGEVKQPIAPVLKTNQKNLEAPVAPKGKIQVSKPKISQAPQTTLENSQPIIAKERGFVTTVKESEQAIPEVKAKLEGTYIPITNKETLSKAKQLVDENYDIAKQRVLGDEYSAEVTAIGEELAQRMQKEGRVDDAIEIFETLSRKATEAGQANQALSIWKKLSPQGMIKFAEKQIQKANESKGLLTKIFKKGDAKLSQETKRFITTEMSKVQKMVDGPERNKIIQSVLEKINDEVPIGASELFDAYRYQNLLSSPRTQLRNAFQNAYQTLINRPLTIAAEATTDWIGSKLRGTQRTTYLSDVPTYYKGLWNSRIDAANGFMNILKGKSEFTNLDLTQLRNKNMPKKLTVVSRLMEGADKYFQTLIGGGEYARLMKNGATEEVAKLGAEKMAQYSLLRNLPDAKNKSGQGLLLSAIDNATIGITELGRKIPLFRWFVPFIRTPMNAAKQWIEYSPLGIATTIGAKNKSSQIAKSMIGSAVVAIGANLAFDDRTTWSAPTDAKEKELFYASGKKPYSIKIGDKWVPMVYFGPQALALAIPAAVKQYQEDSRTALTDSQIEKVTKTVTSMLGFFSEQTFLQGMGNFVRAVSGDADYTFAGNISGAVGQVIPLSSLQRYIAQIVDPIFRKTGGTTMTEQVGNQFKSQIPFLTKSLEPYTSPDGELSKRNLSDYIAPYSIGQSKPEYDTLLEQRQSKLQENAVLNKQEKELLKGKTSIGVVGEKMQYVNEEGNVSTINLAKLSEIAALPTTNRYETAIKESKQFSQAGTILDNDYLTQEQKQLALTKLGIDQTKAAYYTIANDDTNKKTMYVMDSLQGSDNPLEILAKQREQVNGQMIASNAVLDNLVDEGLITKAQATQLKKYKYENGTLTPIKKSTGTKAKKISIKRPTLKKIKMKQVKIKTIKTKTFKPIKLKVPKKLKVKKLKMNKI